MISSCRWRPGPLSLGIKRRMNKKPLFRKVNTKAHGVHHGFGGDYCDTRNSRARPETDAPRSTMHGKTRRGLDYTPLFRFLLSKVGSSWDDVYSEAVARLDRADPIFWIVAVHRHQEKEYVRSGESSFFSGLRVDDQGRLQLVNPALGPESFWPQCRCCTHTFNGVRFTRAFDPERVSGLSEPVSPDPSVERTV